MLFVLVVKCIDTYLVFLYYSNINLVYLQSDFFRFLIGFRKHVMLRRRYDRTSASLPYWEGRFTETCMQTQPSQVFFSLFA